MATLERFGFTPTEARVYEALLKSGASTGYAVSKAAGLARANTYQALDGLVRRGAARRSATIPARYAALAPAQVIEVLERGLQRDLASLHQSLRSLPQGPSDAAQLVLHETWPAFEASLGAAIGAAHDEVLVVAGPWTPQLPAALAAARARGVVVKALWLDRPAPEGVSARDVAADDLVAYWSGRPAAAVVDRTAGWCGVLGTSGGAGIATSHPAIVPFLRHLLRREFATI